MPRMTADLLVRCTGQTKRKRDESPEQLLRRITHLYCFEKGIEAVEGLSNCHSLSVLYLYDNLIGRIENLASCSLLTHLYLQNNHLTRIENLAPLHKLTKLYLSGNAITVVEGLEGLTNLTELHISNQRLPEGEKLLFDPRSLIAIADSLTVLSVSSNGLDNLDDLQCLTFLTQFSACDNELSNMKNLNRVFSHWPDLSKLELSGNPLCKKYKYRDRVITMGRCINVLDGREVGETERKFLMSWKAMRKARRKQQRQTRMMEEFPGMYSGEQQLYLEEHVLPKILSTMPAPPLTLPALPARQLPRRNKKQAHVNSQQNMQFSHFQELIAEQGGQLEATHNMFEESGMVDEGLKLPEIVPKSQQQHTQFHHGTMIDSLSPLKNQSMSKSLSLRTVHVGPSRDGATNRF